MSLSEQPASKQDLQDLANQMDKRFEQVDKKFDQVEKKFDQFAERFDQMIELMRGIETNMLSEFHRYARGQAHRLHTIDTVNTDVLARVALIEDRLLELEGRIRPKH